MYPPTTPSPWEIEGRRLAPLLDGVCAVVVAGTNASAAAEIAIGIARLQGARRRVAIADLVGEVPVLEALVQGDDPHGISDSFLYGVSLNKIARPVPGTDNVFLMPSGTESVAHEAVYANDRWRRLAAGFHQVGALLLVVAVPGTPGFTELCGYVGALMPAGDTTFPTPAGIPLIAPPAPPQPAAPPPPKRESAERARAAATEDSSGRQRKVMVGILALGAIGVAVGAYWPSIVTRLPAPVAAWFARAEPDSTQVVVPPTPMDSAPALVTDTGSALRTDSTGALLGGDSLALPPASPPLTVSNPTDSASAARYAVYFAMSNTREAAMPDARVRALSAVALSPVAEGSDTWFRVTIGASASRAAADSLLSQLRAEKIVSSGSIVAVPYALRLETGVPLAGVPAKLSGLTAQGLMVYALRQADGSATLYTGAFESPQHAATLADSLRALGVAPVLVYRTGRAF